MLRNASIDTGVAVGAQLAKENIHLSAVTGSLLGSLVNYSTPSVNFLNDVKYGIKFAVAPIDGENGVNSEHNAVMDYAIEFLTDALRSHLGVARNVVRPIVVEQCDKAAELVKLTCDGAAAVNGTKVIPAYVDPVASDFVLEELIEKNAVYEFKELNKAYPEKLHRVAERSLEDIKSMVSIGNANTDQGLTLLLSKYENSLEDLFKCIFCKGDGQYYISNFIDKPLIYANEAIICFVIANRLEADVDSSAGISLHEYKHWIGGLKQLFASVVMIARKMVADHVKNDILVLNKNVVERKIYVVDEVYKSFLEQGGDVALLHALLVMSGRDYIRSSVILENANDLIKSYNSYIALSNKTNTAKLTNVIKASLIRELGLSLNNLTEVEKEYMRESGDPYLDEVMKRATKYLDSLDVIQVEDVSDVVTYVMSACRFYFTGSYPILKEIQRFATDNPECAVSEAVLHSAITYLNNYFVKQIIRAK
jgi:hypothetical protein